MDVRLLGPFEVWDGSDRLPVGSGKQAALLALLVLHGGEAVSNERLVEALWDGRPPPTAPKNVQIYVSQLRKAIGEAVIETRVNGYAAVLDVDELDATRFERLVERGSELLADGDDAAAAATLSEALRLWRGPALAEFAYADFAQPEIARLEELRLAALEDRIDADLALGRQRQVVPELESLVRDHPLRERLRGQLMLALYRDGRQADALEVFRAARQMLVDELGLEPSRSLQELERQILEQDPNLEAPRRRRVAVRSSGRRALIAVGGVVAVATALTLALVAFTGGSKAVHVRLNAIGVIDPKSNKVVAQIPVGVNPVAIAVADGSVWVANEQDRTVSEIDARSRRVVRVIALDGVVTGLTAAGGFLWVLNASTPANTTPAIEITKINPRFGGIVDRIPTDLAYGETIEGDLAVTGDTAWVPSTYGYVPTETLEQIDLATHRVSARFRLFGPRRAGEGITYGNGAVWLHDARGLVRLDPLTGNLRVAEVLGGGGVALGFGRVWVGSRFLPMCLTTDCARPKPGYVAEIDREAQGVDTTIHADDPVDVAVGSGSVWVVNRRTRTVQRIDPATGRTVATIPLGNSPIAVAVGAGAVWVAVS